MWAFGNSSIVNIYNIHGELLDSIKTKSWNLPSDIAISVSEDVVSTDYFNKSVNVIKDNWIRRTDQTLAMETSQCLQYLIWGPFGSLDS